MALFQARCRLLADDYAIWRNCGKSRRYSFRHAARWAFGRNSYYVALSARW
jgi:hypothetical protein